MIDEDTMMGKIVSAAMLGLLGWMAYQTYNLSLQQAVIQTEVSGVKELIVQMQNNYMTRSEADLRIGALENEMTRLRDTVRSLVIDMQDKSEEQ